MIFKKSSKFPRLSIKVVSFAAIHNLPLDTYLTDGEQHELSLKNPARCPGWLASRFAVKQAVSELAPRMQSTDFAIGHSTLGAPQIITSRHQGALARITISISHTKTYGAAVAGPTAAGPVGIDIEYVREFADATLRAFLTAEEYRTVRRQPPPAQAALATQYWSCKEAYLKAQGVGLRVHPQNVPVTLTRAKTMQLDNHVVAIVSLGNERGDTSTEPARATGAAGHLKHVGQTARGDYVAGKN